MKKNLGKLVSGWLLSGSLLVTSATAHAWGYDGHRIAADVAAGLLSPQARVRVAELLMGGSLADAATYMDDERMSLKHQIPGSDKWHYNNMPICEKTTPSAVCRNGDCATTRIDQLSQILANRKNDQASRIFAVKALVHLIADIHQPLHAADDGDHGGNDIEIGRRNLHSEWDSGMVKKLIRRQTQESYAAGLLVRYEGQIKSSQNGNASAWATESHDLAVRVAYGALPGFFCGHERISIDRLPASYYETALPVVELQLAKAGARIAFVLNRALGS